MIFLERLTGFNQVYFVVTKDFGMVFSMFVLVFKSSKSLVSEILLMLLLKEIPFSNACNAFFMKSLLHDYRFVLRL